MPRKGQRHSGSVILDGDRLRDLREGIVDKRGRSLTHAKLATDAQVSVSSVQRAERGEAVSEAIAQGICGVLRTDFKAISRPAPWSHVVATSAGYVAPGPSRRATPFNHDPGSGEPDPSQGLRECPSVPGRLSFVKWWDPGDPDYDPTYPCDRPNRAMAVRYVQDGRRHWWEHNLTAVVEGREVWKSPAHVWIEVEHQFPAMGNHRTGLVLNRIDSPALVAQDGSLRMLSFFVPGDVEVGQREGEGSRLFMRWSSGYTTASYDVTRLAIDARSFEDAGFVITATSRDR